MTRELSVHCCSYKLLLCRITPDDGLLFYNLISSKHSQDFYKKSNCFKNSAVIYNMRARKHKLTVANTKKV